MTVLILARRNADCGRRFNEQIRRVKIILAGDADQCKQRVASGVTESRPHQMRCIGLADRTDRPVRCDPFAGFVRQNGGQSDLPISLSIAVV